MRLSRRTRVLRKPRKFKVCFFKTPLAIDHIPDFKFVIRRVFNKTVDESQHLFDEMMINGIIVLEITSFDIAETKAINAYELGKSRGFLINIDVLPIDYV